LLEVAGGTWNSVDKLNPKKFAALFHGEIGWSANSGTSAATVFDKKNNNKINKFFIFLSLTLYVLLY
jgi:hypothetical protein